MKCREKFPRRFGLIGAEFEPFLNLPWAIWYKLNRNTAARAGRVQNDRQAARQIAAGNRDAFAAFVDAHGPRLLRLARRYALCEADAEDLVQETFVDLYRGMGGFRGDSSLSTWTTQVALNHCRKHLARRPVPTLALDDARDQPEAAQRGPAHRAAQSELSSQVHLALNTLSEDHREVVILHELQELTYAECAAVLQVPIGTVKSRLSYAFRRLRGSLDSYVHSDGEPTP